VGAAARQFDRTDRQHPSSARLRRRVVLAFPGRAIPQRPLPYPALTHYALARRPRPLSTVVSAPPKKTGVKREPSVPLSCSVNGPSVLLSHWLHSSNVAWPRCR